MLPAFMAGMKKKEALNKAKSLLADVHLEHRMHHYPSQMSGGERQRASVARSLINDPSLVLADEPTGNLDTTTRDEIFKIFKDIKKNQTTIIMVTHDTDNIKQADRAIKIVDGKIIA